ncbi:hypothetical protein BMS3Abin07_01886 [bacterium BMS3Abin07]|nr:hypothetical protein BMS3Abin07_01886 [bacterium BMS3Abin07]GBE32058.1 hypothetical protein BMS3Bbin05_00966 [bacterium BMS3Bbin05]
MNNNFKIRVVLLLLGLLVGWVVGVFFGYIWYLFTLVVLGYGDSGPQWINKVTACIQIIMIIIGIIASQWYYHYAQKRGRL